MSEKPWKNQLNSFSPSEWDYGRMQGNIESQMSFVRTELHTLANSVLGLETRVQNLEKLFDQQKTRLIVLIGLISGGTALLYQAGFPLIRLITDLMHKGMK